MLIILAQGRYTFTNTEMPTASLSASLNFKGANFLFFSLKKPGPSERKIQFTQEIQCWDGR